jgi:homoserine O-acetyltransferase
MSLAPSPNFTATDVLSPDVPASANPVIDASSPSPAGAHAGEITRALLLRHSGKREVRIAWESQGPVDAPLVIVAGGISGHRHVAAHALDASPGWWDAQVGPRCAIDTEKLRVLAIDWLGADGTLDVPIDSADQADAIAAVLDALGIGRAAAFVGASYGAMVGLQFAARHGQRLDQLIAISGAHRSHPFASAWRALQRSIVLSGIADPHASLALARQLAMLSYRTPEEFAERFTAAPRVEAGRVHCDAEDYLAVCGERYAQRWSATAFLRLSESVDLHAIDPATVHVPTMLVAVTEDRLVPSADIHALAEKLGARHLLHHLRSRYGHDAFLKEHERIAEILRETLAQCCGVAA